MADIFRIHPAIGLSRVGNSEEYLISPETIAGLPVEDKDGSGGLPIKAGTEDTTITSSDIRDGDGALKRQAARFRIFQYDSASETYPNGGGTEIQIGSSVGGKTVADIIWTVHVANKKANNYVTENGAFFKTSPYSNILDGYKQAKGSGFPPTRNPDYNNTDDPSDPKRLKDLVIDPGPRAIKGTDTTAVKFDKATAATYGNGSSIESVTNYPKSFPSDTFTQVNAPQGIIETLGELQTDAQGRLLVLGGYGRANGWYEGPASPDNPPMEDPVDDDNWFDDTSDGSVQAVLVYNDGTTKIVDGNAWVVITDPSYAPQTLNVISLWDDIYDLWVRSFNLRPDFYTNNAFVDTYRPAFDDEIHPFFRAAGLQRWNTNLNSNAIGYHKAVDDQTAANGANGRFFGFIRNPNKIEEERNDHNKMPLSLGDQGHPLLFPTLTQYFFLTQWSQNKFDAGASPKTLGPGEYLDKANLMNCLGGRYSPGIDMTFIVRQAALYQNNWGTVGPFRINAKPLDYTNIDPNGTAFLTEGYVPIVQNTDGLEPGDTSKFMAVPWHADYNSCAAHPTDLTAYKNDDGQEVRINANANDTANKNLVNFIYWSWPAQRPVAVYRAQDVAAGKEGQVYSIRGTEADNSNPAYQGRYQKYYDFTLNWQKVGIVIEGIAVDGLSLPENVFVEVESQLDEANDTPAPWPLSDNNPGIIVAPDEN